MSEKPTVFNYKRYLDAIHERDRLSEENRKLQIEASRWAEKEVELLKKENEELKQKIANLQIRCRITESKNDV